MSRKAGQEKLKRHEKVQSVMVHRVGLKQVTEAVFGRAYHRV